MSFHLTVTALFWLAIVVLVLLVVQTARITARDNRRNDHLWDRATVGAVVRTAEPAPITSRRASRREQAVANLNEEVAVDA